MRQATNNTIQVVGLLGVVLFAVLIWLGWRVQPWMSKQAANTIRKLVGLLTVVLLGVLVWFCWEFRPWMSAGRAIHISSKHLGDYDFQVWQRKNDSILEPFATGLFVRKQGGQWKAFLLDFEDTYRSPIVLRKEDSGVSVFYGSSRLGSFDETQQVFKRDSDKASFTGAVLNAEPPGSWWLKPGT